jgi:hypothetical protein
MRVLRIASVVVVAAVIAAGCGEEVDPISGSDAPAVTSPGTSIPYESGGADGSGSDGRKQKDAAGGVAAGRDVGSGS